jgi:hypothetical protein
MIRLVELAIFFAPLAAFLLWRAALARGLPGPEPRQLAALFAGLILMCGVLLWLAERDSLPPGRYIPAAVVNGQIIEGHSQSP